jgi:hypothetical protein
VGGRQDAGAAPGCCELPRQESSTSPPLLPLHAIQAECYHYLFEAAVRMRAIGVDPALTPARSTDGIGAARSYEALQAAATGAGGAASASSAAPAAHQPLPPPDSSCACCSGASAAIDAGGFSGATGTVALNAAYTSTAAASPAAATASLRGVDAVLLDIEGCTTSIAFVTDTLFPFAAQQVRGHAERVTS